MTDTVVAPSETLVLVDEWLAETASRELFSSDDVRDHLLDIRLSLTE